MPSKIRKQIYLDPQQESLLKSLSKQSGMSEAEMIRQALDLQLGFLGQSQPDLNVWETELEFIESLQQRSPISGRRDWTRDELHER